MSYKTLFTTSGAAWDAFVAAHPDSHTLQTSDWGRFKSEFGWTAQTVAITEESSGAIRAGALLLYKRAHRFIPLSIGYIPCGPLLSGDTQIDQLLWQGLDTAARGHGAAWLKVEPCDWYRPRPDLSQTLRAQGFRESAQTVQPPRTIVIDLDGSEEDTLKRMNQSTRRKAKMGAKMEVDIRFGARDDVRSFTSLMAVTGSRDKFGVHEPEYYERAFELFAPGERCALVMASHAGQDLAGVMVFRCGDKAYYLYGASSNEERNRMPTYIAQWAAIRWAHDHGAKYYDFWGIPDAPEATLEAEFENRRDGLWGVYGFKRGWGGRIVRSVGAWDKVYLPPVYMLYQWLTRRGTGE
jgi:peptidoglycan pentaglycine glycine transferase (the first glycine)